MADAEQSLPERPNLEYLKKLAKEELALLRADEPRAKLADAQLAVARRFGFSSWRAIKSHVDSISQSNDKPLIDAASNGDVQTLTELLATDPSAVHRRMGVHLQTLLHLSATEGHVDAVKLLIDKGADPNVRDKGDNALPIHFAAERGHLEVVKVLVEGGSDVQGGGDVHGLSVIGWATCFRPYREKVAEYLLSRGAKHHIFSAVAMGDLYEIRRIVETDPSAITRRLGSWEHHSQPMHLAVQKKRYEAMDLLVELGAEVDCEDSLGRSPFALAMSSKDESALKTLKALGATPPKSPISVGAFTALTPILNVKDAAASIKYYTESLGFKLDWEWGEPVDFCSVSRDKINIFLCQDGQGQSGTWMSIFVDDVDAVYEQYKQTGANIRQPPTNYPWGMREMNVEDLDGHRLRIGCGSDGETEEESTA